MNALSEDLQAFLEAERDIDAPALDERERLLERLQPLLAVPVALAAASVATSTTATGVADGARHAVLSAALKAKIAVAVVSAALVGGAAGVTGHAYFSARPARTVRAPGVTMPSAPVPLAVEPVPPPPEAPALVEPAPSAAMAPSVVAPRGEQARPAGSLRAERLLLETASAALMRGDRDAAIVALRKHAQKFPHGDLAAEREVLLKKALAVP